MIVTTFNMHHDTLEKITVTAWRLGMSRRHVIMMLLMRLMNDQEVAMGGFTAVKYQSDDDSGKWHRFHFRFKPDEYEFCVDLRKLCKCSVSLLIAKAADKYCGDMLKDNFVDKYPKFSNYVLHRELNDGIICWHLYWGYPAEHLKNIIPIENPENAHPDLPG